MHNGPIRDERIVEALDACRPGSADVANPELALLAAEMAGDRELEHLYERLQRTDARLAAAFQDVPVPEGLADRLLASLAADRAVDEAMCGKESPEPQGASPVGLRPRRVSRRWLVAAAVPLAAAAGLFAVFVIGLLRPPVPKQYNGSMIMEEAISLFMREMADPKAAHHGPADARPKEFPLSHDLQDTAEIEWRTLEQFAGRQGVAYDIPGPPRNPQVKATLYVIRCSVEDLPEQPRPELPECRYSTGNCYTLAWQDRDRGLLYVLVYNGREDDWRYYLKPPRPWA
jgi:hypothetical protein